MFSVVIYFITPKGFHHKVVPLNQFHYSELPNHVVMISVLDDNNEARLIFVMKNRVKVKEDAESKKVCFYAEGHEMAIPCIKGKIIETPFFQMRTISKMMVETKTSVYRKLVKRVEGYAKKKKIHIYEVGCSDDLQQNGD